MPLLHGCCVCPPPPHLALSRKTAYRRFKALGVYACQGCIPYVHLRLRLRLRLHLQLVTAGERAQAPAQGETGLNSPGVSGWGERRGWTEGGLEWTVRDSSRWPEVGPSCQWWWLHEVPCS